MKASNQRQAVGSLEDQRDWQLPCPIGSKIDPTKLKRRKLDYIEALRGVLRSFSKLDPTPENNEAVGQIEVALNKLVVEVGGVR